VPLSGEDLERWWNDDGKRELRQLLYWRWDPIGVNDAFPRTEGEYDAYGWPVLTALSEGADGKHIARVLRRFEREEMGVGQDPLDLDLGQAIVTWYHDSQDLWTQRRSGPTRRG
jgi:hypothetical protein